MRKLWLFAFAMLTVFFFNLLAFAQDALPVAAPAVTDPNQDFLNLLLQSLGGIKGASSLAVAAVAVKVLLKLLDLPFVEGLLGKKFSDWTSGMKLTIVLALSYVGGILALMLPPTSLPLGAALVHSTTLSAFVVLSNQLYQHYIEKKPTGPIVQS